MPIVIRFLLGLVRQVAHCITVDLTFAEMLPHE